MKTLLSKHHYDSIWEWHDMPNGSNVLQDSQVFTVQFDSRISLTQAQLEAIEKAIQNTVAEQIAVLSIPAEMQALPKLEGLPDPNRLTKNRFGALGIIREPIS